VRHPQLKGFLTFPLFARDEDWYVFVFVARDFEGELIDSPEGNLHWVDDTSLNILNLWEGDSIFLPYLDRPGVFSGKFLYQEGRLVSHTLVYHGESGR
jgi:8-oxo-dGTP diphosphatase